MSLNKRLVHWTLKNVPDDVFDLVKDVQCEREKQCKCKKSLEQVIYFIVREYKKTVTPVKK